MELYWDLVAFNENVRVAREAWQRRNTCWEDNKRQVEVGTLAPIEVTRAEAQIATGEQQLIIAQTQVLQQETILKTALSRTGVASPSIAEAHIIPTDQIHVPDVEPIAPIQDMTAMALSSRPELAQSRIQLPNQELTIRGSKNALLPTLDAVVNFSNGALAGEPSHVGGAPGTVHSNNPFFVGGYGTGAVAAVRAQLPELFARVQPEYSDSQSRRAGPGDQRRVDVCGSSNSVCSGWRTRSAWTCRTRVIGVTQARAQYQAARRRGCCRRRRWTRSRRSWRWARRPSIT